MKFDLRHYLAVLKHRFGLFLLVAGAIIGLALTLAMTLPTVYRANANLLVEPSLIPGDLAASTVRTDALEQLQIIQQRLYARGTLLDLAATLDIKAPGQMQTPDRLLRHMRDSIVLDIRSGGRGQATLVAISADAKEPQQALSIANAVVSFVLTEDTAFRTEMAGQTFSFFQNEVVRLGEELDAINAAILSFMNENVDALPEGAEYRFNRQSILQERLAQIRRERTQLAEQRNRLLEVFEETGQVRVPEAVPMTPAARELQDVRAELNRNLAVFSETNPRIKLLRARVAQLEAQVEANAATVVPPTTGTTQVDVQLAELDARQEQLDEQITAVETEIAEIDAAIRATPANAIALDGLERNYENMQAQYNAAVERLSTAATGERIEVLSKGQRISVVEQAVLPRNPVSPNRILIVAGGLSLGLGLGLALVFLLEMLRDTVQRPSDLTRTFGITPLATIPYVTTGAERWRTRLFWSAVILGTLLAGFAIIIFLRGGVGAVFDIIQAIART